jgi:glyoxylase-like metal-dependent hydrolase (beta-lactamase superfamily II)
VRELLPGISTWGKLSERHGYDFNGTFVRHAGGNLCIDPVEPDAATLDELAELGVARVLITNRNHVRAANAVRERTGAAVAIHPADADYARAQGAQLDAQLAVGERVGPFSVVAMPGKSPGEVALFDPARRILIVGDAVVGNPPGELALLSERVIDDPALLRASLRRALELDFDAIVVGDGVPILSGAREQLRDLVSGWRGSV